MITIDQLLAQPRIVFGNFRNVTLENAPEAKLEEALVRLVKVQADSQEVYENNKNLIRDMWRDANGLGYGKVDFKTEPFPSYLKNYKTFEGWFNYFYAECNEQDRKEFYKECLDPKGVLKGDCASKNASTRNAARRAILTKMLEKGFVAFEPDPASYYGTADQLLMTLLSDGNHKVYAGFRGDLRPPATVKLHGGTVAKAQIEGLRDKLGMNEAWHPFYGAGDNPSALQKAYYRKGNADNCLFTVVSVATDFKTASKFPLMQDLRLENPQAIGMAWVEGKGLSALDPDSQHQAPAKRAWSIGAPPVPSSDPSVEQADLACVRTNIYVFTATTTATSDAEVWHGWNTQKMQLANHAGTFPERATMSIPWGNHLARLVCDRIQYNRADSNKGHLLIVHRFELLQGAKDLAAAMGGSDRDTRELMSFLGRIVADGKLKPNGTGGIHVPVDGPAMRPIERVLEIYPPKTSI